MQTDAKTDRAKSRRTGSTTKFTQSIHHTNSAENPMTSVIASLTEQLRQENEAIAKLLHRQRQLRQELLKAQEQSLAALRHCQEDND